MDLRRRKWQEAGGKLHNEELHNRYTSPNIIRMIKLRRMRWQGHLACMEEMKSAYIVLVEKFEVKRPLGRGRHRWKDNIRMDIRETGWVGMNWIYLTQDRDLWQTFMDTVMNLCIPYKAGNFSTRTMIYGVRKLVWT
jgi:hypothetical protein